MSGGPRRLSPGDRVVIATHNRGKLMEMRDLLAPFGVACVSARDLGLSEPEETGKTFAENAAIKAVAAAKGAGMPALADNSGLIVPALDGEPGIHSARWAGPARDFREAMERVHRALGEKEDRGAEFVSVLALAWPDGSVETFEGTAGGTLVWPPVGRRGFGYDPMFRPEGRAETFGEMDPAQKHAISHRAAAFRKFAEAMGWTA